jgi:hypothetical protein
MLADCMVERRVQLRTDDATELDPNCRQINTTLRVQATIWASYHLTDKTTAALKSVIPCFDLLYKVRAAR